MTDDRNIHLRKELDPTALDAIADNIRGDDIERLAIQDMDEVKLMTTDSQGCLF